MLRFHWICWISCGSFFFFLLWHRLYLQTLRWSQMWPLHALYAKWKKNINSQSFQPVQSFCSINTPATKGSIRFANEEANRRCRTHRRLKGNQMHLRLSVLRRKLMSVPMCAHSLFSRFINPPCSHCSAAQLCHPEIECTWRSITSTLTIIHTGMMSHAFLTLFGQKTD